MNHQPKVIAIIFARGGSKGVPRKNVRKLHGIPLLGYTVAIAARAKNIDRVFVSTEDDKIAKIAMEYGAEVPFLRPEHLAQDNSDLNDVMNYTREHLKSALNLHRHYITVSMFPTNPFRNLQEVEFLVEKSKENFQVSTVSKICHSRNTVFSINDRHLLHPLLPDQATKQKYYRFNGYYLATNWGLGALPNYLHELHDPISSIDIDTWEDFFLAESVMEHNLFDFGVNFRL